MLHELEKYYRARSIYSEDFRCCHKDECGKNCAKFTEAASAFIGTQYERGTDPVVVKRVFQIQARERPILYVKTLRHSIR
jgi:hypothetical protein